MKCGSGRAGRVAAALAVMLAWWLRALPSKAESFPVFESGPVRPLALAPDGSRLFAVNTPDNRLEIFTIDGSAGTLAHEASVAVGLEPVAVAARNNSEVWVVNHLSDSVSVVDVAATPPRVVRTLLVGDEPRDVVFAGPGKSRAFITTAHRGQNVPYDPQFTTPGVGRADVWVFDANDLGASLGGTPLQIVQLFGDTPRSLAATPDGTRVYAAVFHSGNQTTAIQEQLVCDGGATAGPCTVLGNIMPGGLPAPNWNFQFKPGPEVGLIVKYDRATGRWLDPIGRDWSNAVRFSLPDYDVFTIDAVANPPQEIPTGRYSGVGTILFNMAVNPQSGKVYVSNTEARNEVRFEGPGIFGGSTVRGRLHQARITVLDGTSVMPRHLNKHIDYGAFPASASVRNRSLATPLEVAVSSDGGTLYVAAFGSGKVGVFSTTELEADTFVPSSSAHIEIPGGGPAGLALYEPLGRLYVLSRFDNGISVVDLSSRREIQHVRLHNPEPYSVVAGRRFLYDARATSSNGEASCSSCHVFADLDSLAWDLGNPDDEVLPNNNPFRLGPVPQLAFVDFHPLKGPMTTQTLRGMATHGPMHWRGDRTGASDPGGNAFDAAQAFKKFNVAFRGLLGRSGPLTDAEMQRFTDFILQVVPPPNPVRNLDNSLTSQQQQGRNLYFNLQVDGGVLTCNQCHVLNPSAGFFGTDGRSSFEGETQHFKIAHLRNVYAKVGMFGFPGVPALPGGDRSFQGDQIRGFGFLHDGSVDTIFRFLTATVFTGFSNDSQRRAVEAFVLAFDSNFAPIVGQQITLRADNATAVGPRIDLLSARAGQGECDLVVKGVVNGEARGWYRTAAGTFQPDRQAEPPWMDAALRALANTSGQELTYSCVPPGSGRRIGVDQDNDGVFDGDERDLGTNPGDERSLPNSAIGCGSSSVIQNARVLIRNNADPRGDETLLVQGEWTLTVTSPPVDPIAYGVRLRVDDATGQPLFNRVIGRGEPIGQGFPGWKVNRSGTRWTYRDRRGEGSKGVRSVTVEDRSKTSPGLYRFKIRGKRNDFQVAPAALPLRITIVLGGPDQGALGQCATRVFAPEGGTPPSCRATTGGRSVVCR